MTSPTRPAGAPRGRALAWAAGAVVLILAAALVLRGGHLLGWLLLVLGLAAAAGAVLALRTASHRPERVLRLPGTDEHVFLEPTSNVRRIG